MSRIVLKPATRQLELLRSGDISVEELAEAHIEQIARLNPQLNVFADFDAERVRAEARRLAELPGPAWYVAWFAGHGEVVDCNSRLSNARLAACCTRGKSPRKTPSWLRASARPER